MTPNRQPVSRQSEHFNVPAPTFLRTAAADSIDGAFEESLPVVFCGRVLKLKGLELEQPTHLFLEGCVGFHCAILIRVVHLP
jgi:hypothetical protein